MIPCNEVPAIINKCGWPKVVKQVTESKFPDMTLVQTINKTIAVKWRGIVRKIM